MRWLRHYGFARARRRPSLDRGAGAMKFTLAWLKDHLETEAAPRRDRGRADRASASRSKASRTAPPRCAAFIVAEIVEAEPHPNADRLRVCTVDTGDGDGAGGLRRAQRARRHEGRVRAARHYVPGLDVDAEEGQDPRRRIERHAVLRARDRASATSTTASSNCPTTRRSAQPAAEALGLDDPVIDIAITPNRGDCLGVRGIARDLAAAGLGTLKPLDAGAGDRARSRARIDMRLDFPADDRDACPHVRRPLHPRREERPEPGLAAGAADAPSGCGRSRRWSTSPTT